MTMPLILIIDDDAVVRETMSRVLKQGGYEVASAPDGTIGVQLYQTLQPDLVVTDILMPEREGIETILDIRRLNPDAPILAISGGGHFMSSDVLHLAAQFGAEATLAKPFNHRQLLTQVKECLSHGTPPHQPTIAAE